jgi:hypothetical protein
LGGAGGGGGTGGVGGNGANGNTAQGGGLYLASGVVGVLSTTTSVSGNTVGTSQGGKGAAGGAGGTGAQGGYNGPGLGGTHGVGLNGQSGASGAAGAGVAGTDADTAGSTSGVTAITVVSVKTEVDLQNQSTGSVLLATFTQGSATGPAKDYSALVQWGDGSSDSSKATADNVEVVVSGTNIKVYGTHTYATAGSATAEVWLTGPSNLLAVADTAVHVAADVTSQTSVQSSALTFNSATGLYDGTVTVTNNGTGSIPGSLDVLFQGLTSGVTLAQASLTVSGTTYSLKIGHTGTGDPYVHIPKKLLKSLASGASVTFSVSFQDPTPAAVTYTPLVFSDPLDP